MGLFGGGTFIRFEITTLLCHKKLYFNLKSSKNIIFFFLIFRQVRLLEGGMFIYFSLSSQGVHLFGRVRLFGSLEY